MYPIDNFCSVFRPLFYPFSAFTNRFCDALNMPPPKFMWELTPDCGPVKRCGFGEMIVLRVEAEGNKLRPFLTFRSSAL
jgi:hypothetical protein